MIALSGTAEIRQSGLESRRCRRPSAVYMKRIAQTRPMRRASSSPRWPTSPAWAPGSGLCCC